MTITKTLQWSLALHLIFISAIIAAGNRAVSYSASGRGMMIISLGRDIKQIVPAATANEKPDAALREMIKPADKKTRRDSKPELMSQDTKSAPIPAKTTGQPTAQAQTPDAQAKAEPSTASAAPFLEKNVPMFSRMRMPPMSRVAAWDPWTGTTAAAPKTDAFLADARKAAGALLAEEMRKGQKEKNALDGQKAGVVLSYNDGRLSGVKVLSGPDGIKIKTLLAGMNWAAVPLPSSYGLSLRSLELEISVQNGAAFCDMRLPN